MYNAKRWLFLTLLALVPLACADDPVDPGSTPDAAAARFFDAEGVTVMTQNMYLGANIDLLLTAQTPAEVAMVFEQLETSTFASEFGRALRLAQQIAAAEPHLVGLQEVTRYTISTPDGPVVLDFLDVLEQYLAYLNGVGATSHSYTAIRNDLTDVTVAASLLGPFPDVRYQDSDAILIRDDVDYGDETRVVFDARETFSVAGTAFENVRGYLAVTAEVNGQTIRLGNTHLEVQRFEDTQLSQTAELIDAFEDSPYPVVLIGDFNSAANPDAPEDQKTPSYHMFRRAGYADLWLRESHSVGGYTCCQAADLTNPASELTQRLDLVLVRYGNAGFGGQSEVEVLGEESDDRIEVLPGLTLWPADHAGVVATFWAAPGRMK